MNKLLFIVLLSLIACVSCQDPCNGVGSIDASCYIDSFCLPFAYCFISDVNTWDNVTLIPAIPYSIVGGRLSTIVSQSGNLTFVVTSGQCKQNVTMTVNLLQYTLTQPKCLQDKFTISVNTSAFDPSTEIGIALGNDQPVTNQTTFTGPFTTQSKVLSVYMLGESCAYRFPLIPQIVAPVPQLEETPSVCAQSNGKLKVTNYNQYTSLLLELQGASTNLTATNGEFTNIQVPNGKSIGYVLYAKYSECDNTFAFPGVFVARNPVIVGKTSPVVGKCNSTHAYLTVQVTGIPSLTSPNFTINGVNYTIGEPILLPVGVFTISYLGDQCNTEAFYQLAYTYQPPATYSVTDFPPTCSNNATITITKPFNGDFNQVSAFSSLYAYVQLNAQHQVQLGYGETMTITNNCTSITIPNPSIEPVVSTSYDDSTCGGNGTIIIQNWDLFEYLQLAPSNPIPFTPSDSDNGVFSNLWLVPYILSYKVKGCDQTQTLDINDLDLNGGYNGDMINYNVEVVQPRTCSNTAVILKVHPIYKNLLSTLVTYVQIDDSGTNSSYVHWANPRCISTDIYFPYQNYMTITIPTFTIVARPQCATSYAQVKISTPADYDSVTVDEILTIPKTEDGVYPFNTQSMIITINYPCKSIDYDLGNIDSIRGQYNPIDTVFQLPMIITPQSTDNCSVANAKVEVTVQQGYNTTDTYLNNQLSINGTWSGVSSSNDFRYNHSYCGLGVQRLYTTTSTDNIIVKAKVISPSTCSGMEGEGDGVVSVQVTYRNGTKIPIDYIQSSGSYTPNTGLLSSMGSGLKPFNILISDFCTIQGSVQVPTRIPDGTHAFKANIIQYPTSDLQHGLVEFTPLYSGLIKTYISGSGASSTTDRKYLYSIPYDNLNELYRVNVGYNFYCVDSHWLNLTSPLSVELDYVIKSAACGSNIYTIEFTQEVLTRYSIVLSEYGQVLPTSPITFMAASVALYVTDKLTGVEFTKIANVGYMSPSSYLINPIVTTSDVSCPGSNDGTVTVTGIDFQSNLVYLYDNYGLSLPSTQSGNNLVFSDLLSKDYMLSIRQANNTYCESHTKVTISDSSPTLEYETQDICVGSSNGSIVIKVTPSFYQASISVNGVPIQGNVFNTSSAGNYIITANLTAGSKCFFTTGDNYFIYNSKSDSIYASSPSCETIIVELQDSILLDPQGQVVTNYTNLMEHFIYQNLPAGTYIVKSTNPAYCYYDTPIMVEKCPVQPHPTTTGGDDGPNSSNILLPSTLLLSILFIISFLF